MRILVIPEDFRKDAWILEPVLGAMFAQLGYPSAKVVVCRDPLLGGVSEAMDRDRLLEVFDRYRGMVDVYLLVVDRDGNAGRRHALDELESWAATRRPTVLLLGENAWQEVEVWALAGQATLPSAWVWQEIRAHPNPKEHYFEDLAARRSLLDEPGAGRKTIGREAGQNYRRVRSRCPEDVQALERRLADVLEGKDPPAHPESTTARPRRRRQGDRK